MKYRDIIGYSKKQLKKKVIKEKSKPKKTILDGIKQEINEWTHKPPTEKRWSKSFSGNTGLTEFEENGGKDNIKEVGASTEYRKYTQKIEKSYRQYWDDVQDFEDVLIKKGLKPAAKQIHKQYSKNVLGFQAWLRKQMDRLL